MQKMLIIHIMKFGIKVLRNISFRLASLARRLNAVSLLSRSEKEILKRNRSFKNKHRGKRAFVIVNGPSLKQQDITGIGSDITFVVSGFFRHEAIKKWQPTYYCFIDKSFFTGSDAMVNFFKQLNEVIKTSTFFLPLYRGYKANQEFSFLDKDRTFYVATAGQPNQKLEMDDVIQSFHGVSAFALAQAVYMGCNPIYLLGFDHDYLANRGIDQHFYSGGTIQGMKANTQTLAERIPYDDEMRANLHLWQNYRSIKRVAKKRGIKIYNATIGGYLDVFERANYEEIFKKD